MMNDFTKEELINIYNAACYELHHGCPPIELEHVKDKIQRMIETYNDCQHLYCRKICIECGEENHG